MTQVRRIQANAVNAAGERFGKPVEQRNLVDRILDDDSGGMQLFARVGLLLDDRDRVAGAGERGRAGEAREARTDHDAIRPE